MCENKKQNEIIVKMDGEILSHFNLEKEYNSLELFKEVSLKFNTMKKVENVCKNCKWENECLFYKKLE